MPNANQIVLLKQMIQRAQKQIETASAMLSKLEDGKEVDLSAVKHMPTMPAEGEAEGEVVEGVFDGVNMVGKDSKQYTVPANYASKSKLVEGDLLKLTILDDGSFIYKQIGPIDRKRVRGTLMQDDDTGEYSVIAQGNTFKVLSASITYYKGEVGDEVVILIPSDKQSIWAAVENIIKQLEPGDEKKEPERDELDKATADLL